MRLSRSIVFAIAVFSAGDAIAQSEVPLKIGHGGIRGFVFRDTGMPIVGVAVLLEESTIATTNEEGMFFVELEAGRYPLAFRLPSNRVLGPDERVAVLDGQETELLITIPGQGAPVVQIEAPEGDRPELAVSDTTTGTVAGVIRSSDKNVPVVGARVFVRGSRADARTDKDGRYQILLPVGRRELTIIHPNHSTATIRDIDVDATKVTVADVLLEPKSMRLAEMVFTAPRIEGSSIAVLRERQDAASVADVLGADQISKAGDSDAAGALSRVTGISVVGGRYVYVRGLGERYSSTLLNGSSLPSPDPERRVVPLDLFPASTIAGLVVQKSYSADLPGELGGGIVTIRTKEIPERFTMSIGLSGQYNSVATLQDGIAGPGGGSDFLGFGVGSRKLPSEFASVTSERVLRPYVPIIAEDGFSSDERERFAEMLDPRFGAERLRLAPDFGVSGEIGGKFKLFGETAGAYLSANFNNGWTINESELRTTSVNEDNGELQIRKNQTIFDVQNEVGLTGLAAAGLDFDDDNRIRLTLGVFRISSDAAVETTGFDDDRGADVLKSRLEWSERMVNTNQLRGEHLLSEDLDLRLAWRYQLSIATRNQPDRRSIRYTEVGGQLLVDPDGTERFFSDLFDLNHDIGADFDLPLTFIPRFETKLKFGTSIEVKDRDVTARRFIYKRNSNRDPAETALIRTLGPNRIFGADTVEPGLHELEESTRSDDNYTGAQRLVAGYVLADVGVVEGVSVQIGTRAEYSAQSIEVQPLPGSDTVAVDPSELAVFDLMPSAMATWTIIENLQLRVGVARTVNRPSFRELSSAAYIDLARGREVRGNPDLERAELLHADARLEWYPSPGESVSIAAFGKRINAPIEYSLSGGANQVSRPVNTESAQNLGIEIEARKNLGFVVEALEDLYVAGNVTFVDSTITIGEANQGILTSASRALQGQSPYLINAQLGYDNADSGTSVAALFNVFGRRINSVGAEGLPDVYEEARPTLDVVFKQAWDRFRVSVKVRNILNTDFQLTQTEPRAGGERVVLERYERGVAVSLGLSVDLN